MANTIFKNFLSRGYFPKELPPSFFSERFAAYATSVPGRALLRAYAPADNFTECVTNLALPGLNHRQLRIPHPYSFSKLAGLTAKNFRRLLTKAGSSPFSKSRPVYQERQRRALRTLVKPSNLARERATARASATFLLKIDVSQFYPSLYTHAVGWAVDPKLRERRHWRNPSLLGKQLDQCLMDLQGKVSQGIPIGNDVSFLLAETVLAQVDKAIGFDRSRAYRWFDDYEFACDSRQEAEETLAKMQRHLDAFRLRINPKKCQILELPLMASDDWHDALIDGSKTAFRTAHTMVRYFDRAFDLAKRYPDLPVLLYAMGALFRENKPASYVLRVAESCITQAVLSEPGCAQKAFSLLQYWRVNGAVLHDDLISHCIEQTILRHETRGASSDVAWALAFCISNGIQLSRKASRALSSMEDDVIAIQSLHANSLGLLPAFSTKSIERFLGRASPDGSHWLALYESVRHGFLPALHHVVTANRLLSDLLAKQVTFYRPVLRPYSLIVHSGGAPDWIVRKWIDLVMHEEPEQLFELFEDRPLLALLNADAQNLSHEDRNEIEVVLDLMRIAEPETVQLEPYTG